MKKLFITASLLVALILTSCGTTVYQLQTKCDKTTPEELFKSISTLLMQQNFIIKQSDMKLGYLQAETMPSFSVWTGMDETRVWVFQYVQGKIIASAKQVLTKKNMFGQTESGAETYYNDNVHSDWSWYWDVRNGLENLCGDKIVITEKKVN